MRHALLDAWAVEIERRLSIFIERLNSGDKMPESQVREASRIARSAVRLPSRGVNANRDFA
jgi:hypothetical protein